LKYQDDIQKVTGGTFLARLVEKIRASGSGVQ